MLKLQLDHITAKVGTREDCASVLVALCSAETLNAVPKATTQQLLTQLCTATKPVVLVGLGRSFCAGGDLKAAAAERYGRGYAAALEDLVIKQLKGSDITVVMSGVTMGFGAGMALAAQTRVATETTKLAFPENGVGLVPDVGASYWLPRMQPRALGLYLALTGAAMNGADCYYAGLATYYVQMSQLQDLTPLKSIAPAQFFASVHRAPSKSACRVLAHLSSIQHHFSHSNLLTIMHSLGSEASPWAVATLKGLKSACPLSLAVCWELFHKGANECFNACISSEFNAMVQLTEVHPHNFEAGLAHLLGGPKPAWQPASLEEVETGLVQRVLLNAECARLRL